MRELLRTLDDPRLAAAAIAGLQLAIVALFARARRREPPPDGFEPPATVLIPCAGPLGAEPRHLERFLAQRYAGPLELLFVTPSEDDPAHRRLSEFLAAARIPPGRQPRLLASGLVPRNAGGKPLDLAWALGRASPRSELFAFADADAIVSDAWLRELAAPLRDPGTHASTAMTPFVPGGGFGGAMRACWLGFGIPYLELTGNVIGQTLALRRRELEEWRVAALWERSLSEDMSLSALLAQRGARVAFRGRALAESVAGMERQAFFSVFNRWMKLFRVYRPAVWALGAATVAAKLWLLSLSLRYGRPSIAALVLAGDAAAVLASLLCLRAMLPLPARPPLREILSAAACAPLLLLAYAANFAASAWAGRVRWGPYEYRVRGPQDVQARRSAGPPAD